MQEEWSIPHKKYLTGNKNYAVTIGHFSHYQAIECPGKAASKVRKSPKGEIFNTKLPL